MVERVLIVNPTSTVVVTNASARLLRSLHICWQRTVTYDMLHDSAGCSTYAAGRVW